MVVHYDEAVITSVDYCLHANTDLGNVVRLCAVVVVVVVVVVAVERRSNSQTLFCLSLSRGITHFTSLPMLIISASELAKSSSSVLTTCTSNRK